MARLPGDYRRRHAGKFGGTLGAARATGVGWRDRPAWAILMNMCGLTELIVLNIGLDLKVISPTLFAMMVLMALVTTVATSPILYLLIPQVCAIDERHDRPCAARAEKVLLRPARQIRAGHAAWWACLAVHDSPLLVA